MYISALHVRLVLLHVRRGCWVPRNSTDRWSWASMWVLENKPGHLEEKPVFLTSKPSLQAYTLPSRGELSGNQDKTRKHARTPDWQGGHSNYEANDELPLAHTAVTTELIYITWNSSWESQQPEGAQYIIHFQAPPQGWCNKKQEPACPALTDQCVTHTLKKK